MFDTIALNINDKLNPYFLVCELRNVWLRCQELNQWFCWTMKCVDHAEDHILPSAKIENNRVHFLHVSITEIYEFFASHEWQFLENSVEIKISIVTQPFSSSCMRFREILFVESWILDLSLNLTKFGRDCIVISIVYSEKINGIVLLCINEIDLYYSDGCDYRSSLLDQILHGFFDAYCAFWLIIFDRVKPRRDQE